MKRSKAVPIGIVAAVANLSLATGCGRSPTHQKVCGDSRNVTVEPEKCEEDARRAAGPGYVPMYYWFYAPYGRAYPIGSPLTGGWRTMPTGKGVRIASPQRGGFGSTARPSAGS